MNRAQPILIQFWFWLKKYDRQDVLMDEDNKFEVKVMFLAKVVGWGMKI